MDSNRSGFTQVLRAFLLLILCGLVLSGCGGGGGSGGNGGGEGGDDGSGGDGGVPDSAGVGGTGVSVARGEVHGRVTQFGSVYVNGQKFRTKNSQFTVDGVAGATQSDLALGMVVRLIVETRNGKYTGKAIRVIYDDEVQGPVAAPPVEVAGSGGARKSFDVFGQTITIDETQTVFEDTSFGDLAANDVVEISGFRTSPTEITATYVEHKGTMPVGSEVELRGTISGYLPPAQEFILDGTTVTFTNATEIDLDSGSLANGLYVEVEGIYQADSSVLADEIEEENEGFGDEVDDVSLQGIISNYVDISNFQIDGQAVDASSADLEPLNADTLLEDGVEIEVEGDIVGGVLVADELELREDDSRIKAFVSFIFPDNERFLVNFAGLPDTIEVVTDSGTLFDDDSPAGLENFSVADMNVGDFVRVEGFESSDTVIAHTVKRQDATDPDDTEIKGQVDSFVTDTSITILGVTYGVAPGTQYEDSSGSVLSAAFFAGLQVGDIVEVEDDVVADGIAEDVELDD